MRARGKSLTFDEEEFEDLVESKDRTFTLLSLLYPFADLKKYKFHIDHVFPRSRFSSTKLRDARVDEKDIPEFQDRADRLPNLQLLVGEANESKSDMLPQQWMTASFDSQAVTEYAERHDLGEGGCPGRCWNSAAARVTFYATCSTSVASPRPRR